MESSVLDAMQRRVLQAVEKVAQNKNLGLVLDRQMVLYGGQDLTKDVLKQLQ
jgi:Skp family chaperone for outer membrane proteins